MATIFATLGGLSGLAGLVGTGISAIGSIYSGQRAKAAAKFEAASMKQKGDADFAIAQREAMRRRKETEFTLSRQRAVAASSGGDVTDPSVQSIMAQTQQEGDYNAMIDMYNGATSRADLYKAAAVRRAEGKSAATASYLEAGSTIYSGLSRSRRLTSEYSRG